MNSDNQQPELNASFDNLSASRWNRLAAAIIDSLITACAMLPVIYLAGGFNNFPTMQQPSLGQNIFVAFCSLGVFTLINARLLLANGQTIGKKICNIKIVDLNGNLPTFKQHLFIRYGVFFLPGAIPVVGGIFNLVDALFIFGSERRCLHDVIAKTKVIQSH